LAKSAEKFSEVALAIETASKLIREELAEQSRLRVEQELSLAAAAEVMCPYYESGSELDPPSSDCEQR
jgi:hypothetical protein